MPPSSRCTERETGSPPGADAGPGPSPMMARTKHTASLPGQGEKRSQHPGVGPPNPTKRTPSKWGEVMVGSGTVLMDCINEGQDIVNRCGRQDAMPQVKNVAWP